MLTALGEPGARPPTPLPAETRLVSTFPAARPGGLARPHSGSRGGRRDGRGPVSPDRAQRSAPPLPLLLSVPILLARHVPGPTPTRHAGNPGDVTALQHSPSRALQKRREGGDVSEGPVRLRRRPRHQNVLRRRLVEEQSNRPEMEGRARERHLAEARGDGLMTGLHRSVPASFSVEYGSLICMSFFFVVVILPFFKL